MYDEVWIGILIAIVAGSFTLLGIFIEYHLHEKRETKRIFKALFDEINLNVWVAERTIGEIKSHIEWQPYRRLYTQSYSNIRSSGYLADLDKKYRIRLEKAFDEVYTYNRADGYKRWHTESLKKIVKELNYLKKQS